MSTTTKQKTEDSCCCWISIMLWWAALYQVCYKLRWTTILWWQFQVSKKPYDPCMKYLYANFVFLERAIIILIKWKINKQKKKSIQVNLCRNLLFLHQLTHNMTKDCSLIYQFLHENCKLRTCCVHTLFWMSKQKQKNNLCTKHVLNMFWAWNFHVLNS